MDVSDDPRARIQNRFEGAVYSLLHGTLEFREFSQSEKYIPAVDVDIDEFDTASCLEDVTAHLWQDIEYRPSFQLENSVCDTYWSGRAPGHGCLHT